MSAYECVIGLEIHAQLMTNSKAFCFAANQFGDAENSNVGPVSGGLPGALPVLNQKAVDLAVTAGLALNCKINHRSVFARKNYFYPDLPKGYQISQFDKPIIGEGKIDIEVEGVTKKIGIERIHMEEDAGKSIHLPSSTLVNLNRSGVPLVEIVSRPDMRSSADAGAYLRKIHSILQFAEVCDGNLEEGNFRCDVNVSVRPVGQDELGTRTEMKNINSFRFVEKSIEYEAARQISVIEAGGKITQETRGWDAALGKTFLMRTKEDAHDYRYFPDPDLPPLVITDEYIESIKATMPELPEQMRMRFVKDFQVSDYDAKELTCDRELAEFFEAVVGFGAKAKLAANWVLSELLRVIKERDLTISTSPISAERLAGMISLIEKGVISGKIAKAVFEEMLKSADSAKAIVEAKGLVQVSDEFQIEKWVDEVIAASPGQVAQFKAGKDKLMGFFVGQVMKLSQGKANPPLVTKLIQKKLK